MLKCEAVQISTLGVSPEKTDKMEEKNRKTGIDAVGDAPFGTHFCLFYETKEDLIDVLVPYFKAGLENNEFCMWVTSEPLSEEEAKEAMRRAVPNFDGYVERGQIEIVPYTEWYLKGGAFNLQRVLNGWVEKLDQAFAKGYDGMRVTGNTAWLEKRGWRDFVDYEREVNRVVGKYRMIALCTYSLDKCGASEILDVVRNHQFAVIKREGKWQLIESSELKRAKETLRENEERLRAVLNSMHDLVFSIDMDGNFQGYYQPSHKPDLYRSPEEFVGKNFREVLPPDVANLLQTAIVKIKASGKPQQFDYSLKIKDKELWFDASLSPVKDQSGRLTGITVVVRDITERKQAEESLRESEEKNRKTIENANVGIITYGPEGEVKVLNPKMEKMTGFNRTEIPTLAEWFEKLYPNEEERRKVRDKWFKRMSGKGEVKEGHAIITTKEGKRRNFLFNAVQLKSGDAIAFAHDITERKKAEEALQDAKEKWLSLTENTDDIVMIVDGNGVIRYINRTMPPYTPEETVGKTVYEYVPREQHNVFEKSWRGVFKTGKPDSYQVSSNIPKIGTIWFSTKVVPIKHNGKVYSAILISSNITDRKKAEEELINSEEHLKEMNKKLEVANEKLHVVGSLTRHDVRNKLTAVTGNTYLLRQRLAENPKELEKLKDIEAAVQQVVRIFEFAEIYEKLSVGKPTYLDAKKILDEAASLFSDLKDVRIVNDCTGLTVLADSLLRQVFYNMIDNSLKYGETIKQIRVYYKMSSGDKLELVYEDDGIGIPSDMRDTLFKEGVGKGTGYGLFMIKRIIEVYGWNIQETGIQGKGVKFVITIPKTKPNGKESYLQIGNAEILKKS